MSKNKVIQKLEENQLKKDIVDFRIGDTVRIHLRIIEELKKDDKKKGETKTEVKERIQIFTGTVIARKGSGLSETISLHRVAYGEGMERVFPLHSPRIAKLEVIKEGDVRRAKLYYLRGTSGKKSKVKGRIGRRKKEAPVAAMASEPVSAESNGSENQQG